jgi:hypothetical protein
VADVLEVRTMIIWDGTLACLAAARIAEAAADAGDLEPRVIAFAPPPGALRTRPDTTPLSPADADDLLRRHRDMTPLHEVVRPDAAARSAIDSSSSSPAAAADPLDEPRLLLEAMAAARRIGCVRVVWPIAVGADLDRLHTATETAAALNTLAAIVLPAAAGSDEPAVVLETPFADLDASGLDALAADLGVDTHAAAEHYDARPDG